MKGTSGSGNRMNEALGSFKDIDEMRFSNVEEEDDAQADEKKEAEEEEEK